MDHNRKITKKFTKKFHSKVINRQYFHRNIKLKNISIKCHKCMYAMHIQKSTMQDNFRFAIQNFVFRSKLYIPKN